MSHYPLRHGSMKYKTLLLLSILFLTRGFIGYSPRSEYIPISVQPLFKNNLVYQPGETVMLRLSSKFGDVCINPSKVSAYIDLNGEKIYGSDYNLNYSFYKFLVADALNLPLDAWIQLENEYYNYNYLKIEKKSVKEKYLEGWLARRQVLPKYSENGTYIFNVNEYQMEINLSKSKIMSIIPIKNVYPEIGEIVPIPWTNGSLAISIQQIKSDEIIFQEYILDNCSFIPSVILTSKFDSVSGEWSNLTIPVDLDKDGIPSYVTVEVFKKPCNCVSFTLWNLWTCRGSYATINLSTFTNLELKGSYLEVVVGLTDIQASLYGKNKLVASLETESIFLKPNKDEYDLIGVENGYMILLMINLPQSAKPGYCTLNVTYEDSSEIHSTILTLKIIDKENPMASAKINIPQNIYAGDSYNISGTFTMVGSTIGTVSFFYILQDEGEMVGWVSTPLNTEVELYLPLEAPCKYKGKTVSYYLGYTVPTELGKTIINLSQQEITVKNEINTGIRGYLTNEGYISIYISIENPTSHNIYINDCKIFSNIENLSITPTSNIQQTIKPKRSGKVKFKVTNPPNALIEIGATIYYQGACGYNILNTSTIQIKVEKAEYFYFNVSPGILNVLVNHTGRIYVNITFIEDISNLTLTLNGNPNLVVSGDLIFQAEKVKANIVIPLMLEVTPIHAGIFSIPGYSYSYVIDGKTYSGVIGPFTVNSSELPLLLSYMLKLETSKTVATTGEPLHLTLEIINNGSMEISRMEVSLKFPSEIKLLNISGWESNEELFAYIEDLDVSESKIFNLTFTSEEAGNYTIPSFIHVNNSMYPFNPIQITFKTTSIDFYGKYSQLESELDQLEQELMFPKRLGLDTSYVEQRISIARSYLSYAESKYREGNLSKSQMYLENAGIVINQIKADIYRLRISAFRRILYYTLIGLVIILIVASTLIPRKKA